MSKPTIAWLLPLLVFIGIAVLLGEGLRHNPREIPSPLINKPAPAGQLDWRGHVTILNVFATWCVACRTEHSVWMEARRDLGSVQLVGLNYKDDHSKMLAWLKQYGNPYQQVIDDAKGDVGINFGVYGTPETFVIDQQGIIRYKFVGPVSPADWRQVLLPKIQSLIR